MECRPGCAICCIYPSISSPLPGMPDGKPAMVRCVNLSADLKCKIFGQADRPKVCNGFRAEVWICGDTVNDAVRNFSWLLK